MEQNRRTLTQSLTPNITSEAMALIKAGTPAPQTPLVMPAAATPASSPTPPSQKNDTKIQQSADPRPRNQKDRGVETVSFSSLSVRVPARLPAALLKAASERKLSKLKPFTQQDIVAEALQNWLQKHGYSPEND